VLEPLRQCVGGHLASGSRLARQDQLRAREVWHVMLQISASVQPGAIQHHDRDVAQFAEESSGEWPQPHDSSSSSRSAAKAWVKVFADPRLAGAIVQQQEAAAGEAHPPMMR